MEYGRRVYAPSSTLSGDLQVLKAMWFSGIKGEQQKDKLESFYGSQAHLYDSYRHRMLHGRLPMVRRMPLDPKDRNLVWVDLAGGTGSNIEYFQKDTISTQFKEIVIVDLCESLLKIAEQRIQASGYENVRTLQGDVTEKIEGLPESGTADFVSFSYALTMIPDWKKAIRNAKDLLKDSGIICICDFTVFPQEQTRVAQWFWKTLFKSDHVYLNEEHIEFLKSEFELLHFENGYGSFPYVPGLFKCGYYVFLGRPKKN